MNNLIVTATPTLVSWDHARSAWHVDRPHTIANPQDNILCNVSVHRSAHPSIRLHSLDWTVWPKTIKFYLPVNIVNIPDVLVTYLIRKLYKPYLFGMACQTMLPGMKVFNFGTRNSHGGHTDGRTDRWMDRGMQPNLLYRLDELYYILYCLDEVFSMIFW